MLRKILNNLLSPKNKMSIKKYIHLMYRLTHFRKRIQTNKTIERINEKDSDIFFGYYDISPFDKSDNKIIYVKRKVDDYVDVVIRDLKSKNENCIAKSYSWNWQQGCRLRWYDKDEISFNDFRDGRYTNRIINICDKSEKTINWALYDISHDNKYGLSLNFERLGFLRPGYGYRCFSVSPELFNNVGIRIIDLSNNCIVTEFSMDYLHSLMNSKSPLSNCYINHLSFSPFSHRFLFFWIEIINGYHQASLITYDLKANKFTILENSEKVSHYVWKTDDEIICTAYSSPNTCKYYSYNVKKNIKELILPDLLSKDGHPSIIAPEVILTDTYPDKHGYQHLYTVDLKLNKGLELLNIYSSPVENGEQRTDLHPRISHSKNKVCIDSSINNNI